jgi:hypothetical protein
MAQDAIAPNYGVVIHDERLAVKNAQPISDGGLRREFDAEKPLNHNSIKD